LGEYRVFETHQFISDVWAPARSGHPSVVAKLPRVVYPQLRRDPRRGKKTRKLPGLTPEKWQYELDSWRLFYEIDDAERIVFLTAADHRGPSE